MKYLPLLLLFLLPATPVFCTELPLKVEWQLITNHYRNGDELLSAFTLTNTGKGAFPVTGWTLYFNYDRQIDAEQTTGNADIRHVNGDIYSLKPTAGFPALKPGASTRITYVSVGELRNYTVAPKGVYLVWDTDPETGIPVQDFHHLPITDTAVAWVTPADVFERNRSIRDIPAEQLTKIFPTPVFYAEHPGVFELNAGVPVNADPAFQQEAAFLSAALANLFGAKTAAAGTRKIVVQKADLPKEAYHLTVTANQVTIAAATPAGAFYGVQSLLSLLPTGSWAQAQNTIRIPQVTVRDEPRFGYRSLSFDVARNFRGKNEVKKVLDLMATYKMNVLHFHLIEDEGWRVEIPALPELTEIGAKRGHTNDSKKLLPPSYGSGPVAGQSSGTGFYTRADFIEILRYATERHIEVIPEIESPGHSRAAIKAMDARYERYMQAGNKTEAEKYLLHDFNDRSEYVSAQLWTDNVMCVAMPSVYTFLETVVDAFVGMYREAQAPLNTIHMGGDEVPAGAWEKSPLCQQLIQQDPNLHNTNDLWYYYYGKLNDMLQRKGLFMSGWEEMALRKTKLDGHNVMIPNPEFAGKNMQVHVWNNVVGWGSEDLPYRLANAGFNVILSPVSNNYFDLSYYKHPDEPGLYWGGHQDIDKPFYFVPYDYYKTTKEGPDGTPVGPAVFVGKDRLTDYGKSHIVGMEGLIWAETLRSDSALEYMILPKMLGFAERAWAADPAWATEKDAKKGQQLYDEAWSVFVNTLGKRELPRLNHVFGGFQYRIPAPGARMANGQVSLNVQFPGLTIRYSTDGKAVSAGSLVYTGPFVAKGPVRARVFDSKGRGSREIVVE